MSTYFVKASFSPQGTGKGESQNDSKQNFQQRLSIAIAIVAIASVLGCSAHISGAATPAAGRFVTGASEAASRLGTKLADGTSRSSAPSTHPAPSVVPQNSAPAEGQIIDD